MHKSIEVDNKGAIHYSNTRTWWCHQMKLFPRHWSFVRGIHRSPVNSPHKGQWRGALMFSLICAWINGWVNNPEASDLRRHHAHYDVIVMTMCNLARLSSADVNNFLIILWPTLLLHCLSLLSFILMQSSAAMTQSITITVKSLNIRCTKSQTLNVSHLILQLSLPNPMKPGVKSKNEDVVGAAPTGDAPTTSEWSTILLLTKVQLILETWRYVAQLKIMHVFDTHC